MNDRHEAAAAMQALLKKARAQKPAHARFPLEMAGHRLTAADVIGHLAPFLTERRRARIQAVVVGRTYALVPVVEGLVNVGNVSAVMRTAEALGCQAFHVVTGSSPFKQSARTSQGAEKWLDLYRWPTAADCAGHLRAGGYRLVAMHLSEKAVPIGEVDFAQKTALVFGNEKEGVTPAMLAECDAQCVVPLVGFTQSFNVSVAAAVALYHARQSGPSDGAPLSEAEQEALRADFYLRSLSNAEAILARVLDP